jgi:uncharacterized protein YdbL (DUF1318 family)
MKATYVFRLLVVCFAAWFGGAAVVHAEDLNAVKSRMLQREGSVDALKSNGLVGENNRGYLEARGSLSGDQQKTVSDENADRGAVYQAIASQVGTSSDAVGRSRAAKIAASSRPGVWIQGSDGAWAKKG